MAKKQKSKLLAMALCASVMTGIYASPVFAGDATIGSTQGQSVNINISSDGEVGGQGLYLNVLGGMDLPEWFGGISGKLTITSNNLVSALNGADVTFGEVTANTISVGNDAFLVTEDGDVVAANVSTAAYDLNTVGAKAEAVEYKTSAISYAKVNGEHLTIINGKVEAGGVDMKDGDITTEGTLVAKDVADKQGNVLSSVANDLDLVEVGVAQTQKDVTTLNDKTQNIRAEYTTPGTTSFKGNIVATGTFTNGRFTATNDGNVTANNISASGDVVTVDAEGNEKYNLNTVGENTQKISFDGKDTVIDGKLVVDKFATSNNSFYVTDKGEINAANNKFWVGSSGEVKAANGNFEIKNNGNVVLRDGATVDGVDVSALSNAATDIAGLKDVTQHITHDEDGTHIEGMTIQQGEFNGQAVANVSGIYTINGASFEATNENGGIKISGVELQQGLVNGVDVNALNSTVEGTTVDITDLQNKTQNMYAGKNYTTFKGSLSTEGSLSVGNDAVRIDGNYGKEAYMTLKDVDGNANTLTSTQLGNINNVIQEDGNVVANSVNVANGAFAASADEVKAQIGDNMVKVTENAVQVGSYGEKGFDGFVSGANAANMSHGGNFISINDDQIWLQQGGNGKGSGLQLDEAGATFTNGSGNGSTIINGGTVTATDDFVTVDTEGNTKYSLNTIGANLGNLQEDFDTTYENVEGITRDYDLYPNDDGTWEVKYTTHIEGALHISEDAISTNGDIFNFTYNTENGFGLRNLGDLAVDVDSLLNDVENLNDRLEVVEDKTHGISYDKETGTTTVDGDLNVNGDAATGEGGNLNADSGNFDKVSTDEITVGDKTYIDGNSVNSVEGNFENITADKGSIGDVGLENGTVTADKVVTGNTTLDNEGLSVGGQTSVTADGVNVGGAEGTSIKHDEITVGDGAYIGDGDVVSGNDVSLNETAGRVDALEQGVSDLSSKVNELDDRIDKVGAMAAAIANLRTMGYDPAAPTEVAVGLGQYRDETGAALGLFHYPNRDFMLSLSVSTSGDEVMGGIGATWKFGRKSPEKVAEIKKAQAEADVRRAEAQKLAKAEELKAAAKEAKIKAQMERHAKLAAERAAEAEAK